MSSVKVPGYSPAAAIEDRVYRTLDVGGLLRGGVGLQVVNGGQVEYMVDLAQQGLACGRRDPEVRPGQVAHHGNHPLPCPAPTLFQLLQALHGTLAHQHMDRAPALQQEFDEILSDKTGAAGDEITHNFDSRVESGPCAPVESPSAPH
jgi:hypothetical protein